MKRRAGRMGTSWSLVLGLALAFGPAASATALELAEARHLLSRAGFGGSLEELESLRPLDRAQAVERLVTGPPGQALMPVPEWADERPPGRDMRARLRDDEEARRAHRRRLRDKSIELKTWWLREMLVTKRPLLEHMTLFWHNHFTLIVI